MAEKRVKAYDLVSEAVPVTVEQFRAAFRGQEVVGIIDKPVILECPADEDMARQEYRLQSDLKYQVQKFGVGVHAGSGVINTDMDLTTALALVEESRQRWSALPVAIRERFSTWRQVEQAAQTGELDQILKAAGLTPASGVSSDASASDSAPDRKADV